MTALSPTNAPLTQTARFTSSPKNATPFDPGAGLTASCSSRCPTSRRAPTSCASTPASGRSRPPRSLWRSLPRCAWATAAQTSRQVGRAPWPPGAVCGLATACGSRARGQVAITLASPARCTLSHPHLPGAQPAGPAHPLICSAQTLPPLGPAVQSLCTEASLQALRRAYPQIYSSDDKLLVDPASVAVQVRMLPLLLLGAGGGKWGRWGTAHICGVHSWLVSVLW